MNIGEIGVAFHWAGTDNTDKFLKAASLFFQAYRLSQGFILNTDGLDLTRG